MRLWPRRGASKASGQTPDSGRQSWDDDPDPLAAYWSGFGGDAPASLQPRGPARIYEDEIDPDWEDPLTELDADDDE